MYQTVSSTASTCWYRGKDWFMYQTVSSTASTCWYRGKDWFMYQTVSSTASTCWYRGKDWFMHVFDCSDTIFTCLLINVDLQLCSMVHFHLPFLILSSKISDDYNPSHISFIYNADIFASIWFFLLSLQVPVSVHVISSLFVFIYTCRFVLSIYRFVLSIYRFVRLSHPPVSLIVQCIECVTCLAKQNPVKVSTNDFQVTLSSRCGLIDF